MASNQNIVPTNVVYSSSLTEQVISQLVETYPFLIQTVIGESVMGRPILCVRIGTGEKEVFYNASFHANEWITTPVLLKFIEEYARAYAGGTSLYGVRADWLFEHYRLYLVPLVNPDGVDLVNGRIEDSFYQNQARGIAADYPQIPFPEGWKANIDGIDLNLQFPAGWEEARKIKFSQGYTSPAPRDFVGEAPLSAPESRAVYEFTKEHDFLLILAYHTQGRVIYWKYLDYNPTGAAEIAQYFQWVSGYTVEETPLVSGYAGYKDWFIMQYNRPGFTIEAGEGINPLPIGQFDTIYEENKRILLGGMTEI